jgi:hypothetical protein
MSRSCERKNGQPRPVIGVWDHVGDSPFFRPNRPLSYCGSVTKVSGRRFPEMGELQAHAARMVV